MTLNLRFLILIFLIFPLKVLAKWSSDQDNCPKLRMQLIPSSFIFDNDHFVTLRIQVERGRDDRDDRHDSEDDHHDHNHYGSWVPQHSGNNNPNDPRIDCEFFIGFGNGASNSSNNRSLRFQNDRIPVQFWKDRGRTQVLRDPPEARNNNDVLIGQLPSRGRTQLTLEYFVGIQAGELPSYGLYQEQFSIRLYEGKINGSNRLVEHQNLLLKFEVPRVAHLSLVDTGAPFELLDRTQVFDYGELSEGESQSCDLIAVFNAGLRLYFESSNDGQLKHETGQRFIPYVLKINGRTINLSRRNVVLVDARRGVSPPGGLRYGLNATIGRIGPSSPTGVYRDSILMRIESIE